MFGNGKDFESIKKSVDDNLFEKELKELINKHSIDSKYNIPDFLLAHCLSYTILSLSHMTYYRDNFFGFEITKHNRTGE